MKKNIKSPKHYNKRNPHYFSYSYSPRTVILLSPKPCVSYTIGFDVHLVTSSSLVIVTKSHLQKLTNLIINFWKIIIAWLLRNFSRLTFLQKTKRDNETRKIGIDILCFGIWFYFRIHYQVIFLQMTDAFRATSNQIRQVCFTKFLTLFIFLTLLLFLQCRYKICPR